jgi:hypothetical protein
MGIIPQRRTTEQVNDDSGLRANSALGAPLDKPGVIARRIDAGGAVERPHESANGGIRWNRRWGNVSITCAGECVGLEEIDDGVWNVYFGPLKLGRLLERHMRIEDAYGRLKRQNR